MADPIGGAPILRGPRPMPSANGTTGTSPAQAPRNERRTTTGNESVLSNLPRSSFSPRTKSTAPRNNVITPQMNAAMNHMSNLGANAFGQAVGLGDHTVGQSTEQLTAAAEQNTAEVMTGQAAQQVMATLNRITLIQEQLNKTAKDATEKAMKAGPGN